MDLRLPGIDGVDAAQIVTAGTSRVPVLTTYDSDIVRALAAGAT